MTNNKYEAKDIEVLEGLEAVRKRPGMYIGGLDEYGLHKLFFEVLENSIDEGTAGYANKIDVYFYCDGSVAVEDNGRGIPVDIHESTGISALELVLGRLHAGGKFSTKSYRFSSGLHGVGVSVVNALSEFLVADVYRDGINWRMLFNKGVPKTKIVNVGKTNKRGTKITFLPDQEMFKNISWNYDIVKNRLSDLANLSPSLTITINCQKGTFKNNLDTCYTFEKNGIEDIVNKDILNPLLVTSPYVVVKEPESILEVAFNFSTDGGNEKIVSFVNTVRTDDGGTHVAIVKSVFTRYFNDAFKKRFPKKGFSFSGEDVRTGISVIIHLKMTDPIFSGQTKGKLSSDLSSFNFSTLLYNELNKYFVDNIEYLTRVLEHIEHNRNSRLSIEQFKIKEKDKYMEKIDSGTLPGKLSDCSSRILEEREIVMVEGDSAGGTAKQARDRRFQAILSLKGKFLNVEKSDYKKVKKNVEIRSLFTALGFPSGTYNNDKLRYGKIIILSDADPDGHHIRVLFLTFFLKFFPDIIRDGRLFIAQPPIYMVAQGNQKKYFHDETSYRHYISLLKPNSFYVQRFKGLGEMNSDQLWDTTMDPDKRRLICVTITNEDETKNNISLLMGEDTSYRKNNLIEYIGIEYRDVA